MQLKTCSARRSLFGRTWFNSVQICLQCIPLINIMCSGHSSPLVGQTAQLDSWNVSRWDGRAHTRFWHVPCKCSLSEIYAGNKEAVIAVFFSFFLSVSRPKIRNFFGRHLRCMYFTYALKKPSQLISISDWHI